jgi:hypothetical protein
MLHTRWGLHKMKKECPAPQSHTIIYKLKPLLTPVNFRWTIPLNVGIIKRENAYLGYKDA